MTAWAFDPVSFVVGGVTTAIVQAVIVSVLIWKRNPYR